MLWRERERTPRNVRQKLNFDEADDDGAMSSCSEEPRYASLGGGDQPAIVRHRRLGQKAPAINTEYSRTRLVNKAELKRLNEMKAEQLKRKAKMEKMAMSKAAAAIRSQPELAHGNDFTTGVVTLGINQPHETHDVRFFAAADTMILVCDTCGRWQRHNAGRSILIDPCEPIREGNKSGRKLLRHAIIPTAGAKLPASVKTAGGKRC